VTIVKAPPLRRVAAYLLDVAMFLVPCATLTYLVLSRDMRSALLEMVTLKQLDLSVFGFSPRAALTGTLPPRTVLAILTAGSGVMGWTLYRVRTAMNNNSLGKRLCGLELVSLHREEHLSIAHSGSTLSQGVRRLAPGVALGMLPIPGTGFLGYAAALLDKNGRGWHDRAAGTMVVLRDSRSVSGMNYTPSVFSPEDQVRETE
jgi:uncharacterized RDD family membrane protein YckC